MQHLASWALESAFRSRWATCERSPSGELGDPRASISSCVKRAQLVLPCGSWREAGRSPQGCGERAQGPAAQSGSARGRDRPRLKHTPRGLRTGSGDSPSPRMGKEKGRSRGQRPGEPVLLAGQEQRCEARGQQARRRRRYRRAQPTGRRCCVVSSRGLGQAKPRCQSRPGRRARP